MSWEWAIYAFQSFQAELEAHGAVMVTVEALAQSCQPLPLSVTVMVAPGNVVGTVTVIAFSIVVGTTFSE